MTNNLIGFRSGRLVVLRRFGRRGKRGRTTWLCKCDCGTIKEIMGENIISKHTKSCGCYSREYLRKPKKHGHATGGKVSSEYNSYNLMITRCYKKTNNRYYAYGARGIKVCARWLESFENFIADMGNKPSKEHSIDRIDNNGNYTPENCKWSSRIEQASNKRSNINFTHNGITKHSSAWAKELGVARGAVVYWVDKGKSFDWIYNHFMERKNGKQ